MRRFGFSANNITYAVFGDMMRYWTFFPADDGWGRIPVWGFAEVVEAGVIGLDEGELVYGYLPMGSELVVTPTRVSEHGFTDATAHRAELPAGVQRLHPLQLRPGVHTGHRSAADAVPAAVHDRLRARRLAGRQRLLRSRRRGAVERLVEDGVRTRSSARRRATTAPRSSGLTSAGNVDFVLGLDVYDRVLTYDDVEFLDADVPSIYVDMAGDTGVRSAVHHQLGGLAASVSVGGTHWEEVGGGGDLPGPAPALFFAPDQIVKRRDDWGAGGVESRFATAWESFLPVGGGLDHRRRALRRRGRSQQTYREVLDGSADPSDAFVLSFD